MLGEIMGKPISPIELWPRVAGHRITEQEYQYLMHVKAWAERTTRQAGKRRRASELTLIA